MRRVSSHVLLAALAVAAACAIAAAPATAASSRSTVKPVAHIFKVGPKTVFAGGAPPQVLVRIDQAELGKVRARLLFTPVKGQGTRVRVDLGEIETGMVVDAVWPVGKTLAPGRYKVKLLATNASGVALYRAPGSTGMSTIRVNPGVVAASASVTGVGAKMVALAQMEVGQKESPNGSNNSPRIAEYRASTPGGPIGPWCAYFTSWLAKQAGAPVGEYGQGYGRVDDVYAWAQRTGKAIAALGAVPQAGDFMVWDEHIGIVESVNADGTITTIDGNYANAVTRRVLSVAARKPIVGYVRL